MGAGGPRSNRLDAEAPSAHAHLDFAADQLADPRVARWHWPAHLGGPRSREQVAEIIARQAAQLERTGYCLWWWRERETGRLVGMVGLNAAEVEGEAVVEVGWSIHPDHQGRGLAPEAAAAACDWGFERCGLERVHAFTMPSNRASLRVMEKLGMNFVRDFDRKGLPHRLYRLDAPPREAQCSDRLSA